MKCLNIYNNIAIKKIIIEPYIHHNIEDYVIKQMMSKSDFCNKRGMKIDKTKKYKLIYRRNRSVIVDDESLNYFINLGDVPLALNMVEETEDVPEKDTQKEESDEEEPNEEEPNEEEPNKEEPNKEETEEKTE